MDKGNNQVATLPLHGMGMAFSLIWTQRIKSLKDVVST